MREIRINILIQAPVKKVWDVLTHFAEYPHWNPFIKSLEGDVLKKRNLGWSFTPLEVNRSILNQYVKNGSSP